MRCTLVLSTKLWMFSFRFLWGIQFAASIASLPRVLYCTVNDTTLSLCSLRILATCCPGCSYVWNISKLLCFCISNEWDKEGGTLKNKTEKDWMSASRESGAQKPPCVKPQPWNLPDPIDSVYLAGLHSLRYWQSGRDLEWAADLRKRAKVILSTLTVWQTSTFFRSGF